MRQARAIFSPSAASQLQIETVWLEEEAVTSDFRPKQNLDRSRAARILPGPEEMTAFS